MSAVPVTLVGAVITPAGPIPTQFVGYAYITGREVGSGPTPGGPPPHIWGGGGVGDFIDAGFPGPQPGGPVKPWGPVNVPDQGLPTPQPPIDPPTEPPENPSEVKPPPPDGGWGWSPEFGWGFFPMSGGKPQPGPGPQQQRKPK